MEELKLHTLTQEEADRFAGEMVLFWTYIQPKFSASHFELQDNPVAYLIVGGTLIRDLRQHLTLNALLTTIGERLDKIEQMYQFEDPEEPAAMEDVAGLSQHFIEQCQVIYLGICDFIQDHLVPFEHTEFLAEFLVANHYIMERNKGVRKETLRNFYVWYIQQNLHGQI